MTSEAEIAPAGNVPAYGLRWLPVRIVALIALAVSSYLLIISLGEKQLPVGCGTGSGCASVLSSRWSSVLGIPVGGAAVALYLTILAATYGTTSVNRPGWSRAAWGVLIGSAAAICAAAVWFIGLQLFVVQAICPWCMVDHGLGIAVAGMIFWKARHDLQMRFEGAENDFTDRYVSDNIDVLDDGSEAAMPEEKRDGAGAHASGRRGTFTGPVAGGLGAVAVLIVLQVLVPGTTGKTIRLPPGQNSDTGPGAGRQVAVINGRLQVAVHEQPILGSADAPKLLLVMYDYCCPHCRATHGYIERGLPTFGGQLGVVMLPMPMDSDCNPGVQETEPRFEHACELARLALAVWRAEPARFAEYDQWLFASEKPRDPREAERQAAEIVGEAKLVAALRDPWIDTQIAQNVTAYQNSGADRIPIIMSPGFSSVVGRPESEATFLQLLREELKLGAEHESARTPPATP